MSCRSDCCIPLSAAAAAYPPTHRTPPPLYSLLLPRPDPLPPTEDTQRDGGMSLSPEEGAILRIVATVSFFLFPFFFRL